MVGSSLVTEMKTLALLAAVMIAGCDAGDAAAPDSAGAERGPLPSVERALARHSLTGSSLPKLQLVATAEGRELLSQVVSCALPASVTVTAVASDGTPYLFTGSLGLAPAWADHPPSAVERGRVTTCVYAHTPGVTAGPDQHPMISALEPAHQRGEQPRRVRTPSRTRRGTAPGLGSHRRTGPRSRTSRAAPTAAGSTSGSPRRHPGAA